MALTNIVLISQIAGYVVALILALCIVVPMSMHQDEFKGHCLLFSSGVWQETDGQLRVTWGSQGSCNYTIFVGVVLFLMSIIQIYRLSILLYKGTDSTFLSAFVDVVTSILLCLSVVIAALMITLGFMVWCQNITQRFPSCEMAAGQAIDELDGIDTKNFYIELGTAQFGVWGSFTMWVGLSVFALLKLCRYHQVENMRVSMYRERQRLVNKNAESPGSSLGRESTNSAIQEAVNRTQAAIMSEKGDLGDISAERPGMKRTTAEINHIDDTSIAESQAENWQSPTDIGDQQPSIVTN